MRLTASGFNETLKKKKSSFETIHNEWQPNQTTTIANYSHKGTGSNAEKMRLNLKTFRFLSIPLILIRQLGWYYICQ